MMGILPSSSSPVTLLESALSSVLSTRKRAEEKTGSSGSHSSSQNLGGWGGGTVMYLGQPRLQIVFHVSLG